MLVFFSIKKGATRETFSGTAALPSEADLSSNRPPDE
jgi:hypothetical protein